MPHLAPINWLIIWLFIWSCFLLFSVVVWWEFKPYYKVPSLSTCGTKSSLDLWIW
nr:TPA_asm: ATP synthase F0 subunit 8 [Depressigyra globulus]